MVQPTIRNRDGLTRLRGKRAPSRLSGEAALAIWIVLIVLAAAVALALAF